MVERVPQQVVQIARYALALGYRRQLLDLLLSHAQLGVGGATLAREQRAQADEWPEHGSGQERGPLEDGRDRRDEEGNGQRRHRSAHDGESGAAWAQLARGSHGEDGEGGDAGVYRGAHQQERQHARDAENGARHAVAPKPAASAEYAVRPAVDGHEDDAEGPRHDPVAPGGSRVEDRVPHE